MSDEQGPHVDVFREFLAVGNWILDHGDFTAEQLQAFAMELDSLYTRALQRSKEKTL